MEKIVRGAITGVNFWGIMQGCKEMKIQYLVQAWL